MTEKILFWFDIDQLTLNVKKSYLLIFSRKGVSCPTITELHTPRGSISRPPDQYVRFLGVLLDENLSFKWHVQIIRVKISRGLGIIRKLKRLFPFPILRFYTYLWFTLIYVTVRLCGCPHFPRYLLLFTIFMWKRQGFSSRLHTLLLTSSKLKIFMFYLYLRWHINTSREISHVVFRDCLS